MACAMPEDWEALRSHGVVSRETQERLQSIVDTLLQWQRKTNLVAPKTLDAIWTRHILDSAQLVSIKPNASKWLDIGSGGGFPALVIAALLCEQPGFSITLVESNHKKTAFLRQAAQRAGMADCVHVICDRIEKTLVSLDPPQVLTARALAALPELLEWSECLWQKFPQMTALFQKGREYESELSDSSALWQFDLVEHSSAVEADSRILELNNLRRK